MSTLYVNTITPNSGDTVSVSGSLFVSGTINLGDANTDSISFGADVSSSILPDANNVYDLGSSTKSWRNVFGTASLATQSISSSNANTASFLLANRAASSQTSITSIGTLTGLNVNGNVVITGSSLTLAATQITGSTSTASFGRITAASQVTASAFTGSFTGSLFGVATSATTASLAISASFIEASNVNGVILSASYTSASTSASHALTAVTASHVAAAGVAGTVTSASQATRVTFTNTTSSFNALTATQVTASSATGSFTGSLLGDATTALTASRLETALQAAASQDLNTSAIFSVDGPKVSVQGITAANIADGAFAEFELRNMVIEPSSVVLGSFNGTTTGGITGSILTAAVVADSTASIQIHNETGAQINADSAFTASFVVL
jgi:hypothetical protein